MKKTIGIITAIIISILAIACTPNTKKEIIRYTNNAIFEDKNIKTEVTKVFSYKGGENYNIIIYIDVISENTEITDYVIANYEIENEENKAKYKTQPSIIGISPYTLKLEYKIKKEYSFSATVPTDIKKDKYQLKVDINGTNYKLHLYEDNTAQR